MATSVKKKEAAATGGSMSLGGHLKELRNRLFVCAALFFVVAAVGIAIAPDLLQIITRLGLNCEPPYEFITTEPQEKLMQYFKIAIVAGVVVTLPMLLYQIWAFAKPGLKKSESFFFGLTMIMGLALFVVGVLFAYNITFPFMLNFMNTLEGAEYVNTATTLANFVSFAITIFLIFGCIFEIPLVTVILSRMGILNPKIMRDIRGVAIVLIFTLAAIITPPDVVSQCMCALPMIVLYQVSIFLSGIFYKKKLEADEEDDEDEEDEEDD
ncbi:MAG: twin-arginine translocase subunit TatC [Faecalibacterium sp.]|nr:twin-arginine translocase subunit TatC [Faecalibacterium sp.]